MFLEDKGAVVSGLDRNWKPCIHRRQVLYEKDHGNAKPPTARSYN